MKPANNNLIIVTDLDGSLLDHHNYSFQAAEPALKQIKAFDIPLIFNTSKTAAELNVIRQQLKNEYPFIVENGAGIIIPAGYFPALYEEFPSTNGYQLKSFGTDLADILVKLHELRLEMGVTFRGFSEMTVEELVDLTGLSRENATLAKTRDFSEPLVWESDTNEWQAFATLLTQQDLKHTVGGRFIHVSGGGDKGLAMQWLLQCFQLQWQTKPTCVVLGDGENDVAMLKMADIGVIIRSPVNPVPAVPNRQDIIVTEAYGPTGWNDAVLTLLKQQKLIN